MLYRSLNFIVPGRPNSTWVIKGSKPFNVKKSYKDSENNEHVYSVNNFQLYHATILGNNDKYAYANYVNATKNNDLELFTFMNIFNRQLNRIFKSQNLQYKSFIRFLRLDNNITFKNYLFSDETSFRDLNNIYIQIIQKNSTSSEHPRVRIEILDLTLNDNDDSSSYFHIEFNLVFNSFSHTHDAYRFKEREEIKNNAVLTLLYAPIFQNDFIPPSNQLQFFNIVLPLMDKLVNELIQLKYSYAARDIFLPLALTSTYGNFDSGPRISERVHDLTPEQKTLLALQIVAANQGNEGFYGSNVPLYQLEKETQKVKNLEN